MVYDLLEGDELELEQMLIGCLTHFHSNVLCTGKDDPVRVIT